MEYEAVIGLETHVQLKTKSKMWCGCANQYGAEPNTNVCPVCLGLPGVLPVPNEEALRLTVLTGYLLNCEIPRFAKFDRKSYFYPDMPKNYQITQYDRPSTANGCVEFEFGGAGVPPVRSLVDSNGRDARATMLRVRITRAHLEEDVGKSFHFERHSGVDFNRAGVPLMEIVSEPDITSADMAYEYLNALKEILMQGGVSDCDMEKGMVRCDVNISVRPVGTKELGAKIEIKNMNSFSGVRRALEYEIPRQIEVLKTGGKLIQSTRRWDDVTGITEEMRTKEHAHDYRYFPDPDLMPVAPSDEWLAYVKSRMVELPLARKQRFMRDYQLPAGDAEVFKSNLELGDYFEGMAKQAKNPKAVANWVINNLRAKMAEAHERRTGVAPVSIQENHAEKSETGATPVLQSPLANLRFKPDALIELIGLVENKTISSSAAQQVFAEMFDTGKLPAAIVQEKGLAQVSDTGAIEKFCDEVIASNPGPASDFKSGKAAALNFLKGQVMKLSKGKANPALVGEILERKLKN
ncbi:MAG: Asp-tRNA(Asn)/Glu-tRNA(Gln) amidotransferase subunit GatB [Verrucomicrobia bacterium]|nr:Asp-tRNA(Asn)/Glu-tRNA(Gln) amidotransferase subunit GatB [Verrucomicrobiota bacterium]